jgi:Uma2 family endonuclease
MSSLQRARATLDDLYRTRGKVELIGARIVSFMPTGMLPADISGRIYRSLAEYADETKIGRAYGENLGYAIAMLPSERESFSPDASFHRGPFPQNRMRFIAGSPHFAVEVRSENDYRPSAELKIAEKQADYFLAGTEVVWDVDPLAECIHVFRASNPEHPTTYRRGDMAEAEPAVPGWSVSVDWIFGPREES